jgi:hypothetical protein
MADAVSRWARAGGALVGVWVIGILACGGTEPERQPALEPPPAPAPAPAACVTNDDCGEEQVCQISACVERSSLTSISIGADACVVVSCPDSDPSCCSGALASATGNQRQSYSLQLHMLQHVETVAGEVRADFLFDAPNQQGWLTFQLGEELDLSRLQVTGRRFGHSDHFLSVNTNRADAGGGCAFAFELVEPVDDGTAIVPEFMGEVALGDKDFCYGDGRPGRASELAFAIFSTEPGPASLIFSNITLMSD